MEEGEEFEQVESRQLGIAEPVAGQRRAEQQVRRPHHRRNRLTAPDALHAPARIGQPDADMARMDRGQGKRIGRHGPMLGTKEERGKMKQARSEEHTSELQSLMRISYAVFCLKKKNKKKRKKKKIREKTTKK